MEARRNEWQLSRTTARLRCAFSIRCDLVCSSSAPDDFGLNSTSREAIYLRVRLERPTDKWTMTLASCSRLCICYMQRGALQPSNKLLPLLRRNAVRDQNHPFRDKHFVDSADHSHMLCSSAQAVECFHRRGITSYSSAPRRKTCFPRPVGQHCLKLPPSLTLGQSGQPRHPDDSCCSGITRERARTKSRPFARKLLLLKSMQTARIVLHPRQ